MPEEKSVAELAAETKAAFGKAVEEVKGIAEEALGKSKKGEEILQTLKDKADEALVKMNELKERTTALEQKAATAGEAEADRKSIGEQFIGDEGVKTYLGSRPTGGRAEMRIKATLTSATAAAAGSVGAAIAPRIDTQILPLAQRTLFVRDLLGVGRSDTPTYEYIKETGFTNAADVVAEGAAKPQSDIQLSLVTTTAKVIAHHMKASRQVLSDVQQLKSVIDQRLIYGLKLKEEQQILSGDGTGQNLLGLIPQATAYAPPTAPVAQTHIDALRLAMLQAVLAQYPASAHILHPTDWAAIEMVKDSTGRYIIGDPNSLRGPTIWGLPVVATPAMTVKKFLTGAYDLAAQIFDLWDARVETGFVNDDFTKNLVTILGEERLMLAVYRPEALIYGDFGTLA